MAARPRHHEAPDAGVLAEPEVHDGLRAGKDSARQHERAHLDARVGLDPHRGPDAKAIRAGAAERHRYPVSRVRVVAKHRDTLAVVGIDDVQVAIAAQVAEGGAKADAPLVEAPFGADVLEAQLPPISVGQVLLGQHRRSPLDPHLVIGRLSHRDAHDQVDVRDFPVHAVCHEQVQPSVVVEILKAHRPCPVGRGQPGQERTLEAAPDARVDVKRIPRDLRRRAGALRRVHVQAAGHGHGPLVLLVRGRRHVGHKKVHQAIVVHVAQVRPH